MIMVIISINIQLLDNYDITIYRGAGGEVAKSSFLYYTNHTLSNVNFE